MNTILPFINLCLFKAGPADMPSSAKLLKLSLLSYFIMAVLIKRLDNDWQLSLIASLFELLIMMIVVSLLLKWRGLQSRYVQTLTAMAGSGCVLSIAGFPIIGWFYQLALQQQTNSIALLLMIALMFWSLMVTAHIFRQSLEISPRAAAMLTVLVTILSLVVTGLLVSGVK